MSGELPTQAEPDVLKVDQEELDALLKATVLLYGLMTNIKFGEEDDPRDVALHQEGLDTIHKILGPRLTAELQLLVAKRLLSAAMSLDNNEGEPS